MPSIRDGTGVACAFGLAGLCVASLVGSVGLWASGSTVACLACLASGLAMMSGAFAVMVCGTGRDCFQAALAGLAGLATAALAASPGLAVLAFAYLALTALAYAARPLRAA